MKMIQQMRFLLLAVLLVGAAPATLAFKLIEAQPVDGTYCAGNLVDCGSNVTFTRWFRTVVPFWVNDNAAADASGVSPTLTQTQIILAAKDAYQAWQDVPSSYLKFQYQGTTSNRIAADGINTTLWYNSALDSDACVGALGVSGGVLAVTILTEDLPLGEITDADVVFDSADKWIHGIGCIDSDVQTVLTHEYGHSIGIHHSQFGGAFNVRPTMVGGYFCDAGFASGRTLELDDKQAAQCLYPELPTVLLLDETGSMGATGPMGVPRMDDAKLISREFIDEFASNVMAVSAFADMPPTRNGFELLQDWTDDASALKAAVDSTSAGGSTPMWESICCALGKAAEQPPSNLLVITDTGENSSNAPCSNSCTSFCGCRNVDDVLMAHLSAPSVAISVIDVTNYSHQSENTGDEPRSGFQDADLQALATATGGIYVSALSFPELSAALASVEHHMTQTAKAQENPPTCAAVGNAQLADAVQVYDGAGNPASPFAGQAIQVHGRVTVARGTFDAGTIYVEDCSGGVQALVSSGPSPAVGDTVALTGTVGTTFGEIRLSPVSNLQVLSSAPSPALAVQDPAAGASFEAIGTLMKIRGYAASAVTNFRFPLVSNPSGMADALSVLIDPDTGINPASIVPGHAYVVTGVLSRRLGVNELKPRFSADIEDMTVGVNTPGEASPQGVPGVAMRASYDRASDSVQLTYAPACDATSHTIYYGPLSSLPSYTYTAAQCSLDVSGAGSFSPGPGSVFFLIVGQNGIAEGSYGTNSAGVERPEATGTPICDRPRNLAGVTCQ